MALAEGPGPVLLRRPDSRRTLESNDKRQRTEILHRQRISVSRHPQYIFDWRIFFLKDEILLARCLSFQDSSATLPSSESR